MPNSILDTYIVDGNITLFFGQHSNCFKQDILNSSLLAHLAANSKTGIASESWFADYRKILGSIFWTTKSHASQKTIIKSASLLTLAELLSNYLKPTQLKQVAECLARIKKLPENSVVLSAVLNRVQSTVQNNNRATTTICPMMTIVCEDKMVISTAIRLEIAEPVGINFLNENLPPKKILGAVQMSQWVTYFGEDDYANVRNIVIQKLGNKVATKLFHLDPEKS